MVDSIASHLKFKLKQFHAKKLKEMIKSSALLIGKCIRFRLGPQCQCIITKMIYHFSVTIFKIREA